MNIARKAGMFLLAVFVAVFANAQAGKSYEILKNTQSVLSASGVIKADVDIKGGGYGSSCTVVMTSSKFTMDMDALQIWFDGKTMWSYNKQISEVNITEPDSKEVAVINPYSLIDRWDKDFKHTYDGVVDGCHKITLTPKTSSYGMKSVTVYIKQDTGLPYKFVLTDSRGVDTTLVVRKFEDNVKVGSSYFVFDKSKYPDAEVVDLR